MNIRDKRKRKIKKQIDPLDPSVKTHNLIVEEVACELCGKPTFRIGGFCSRICEKDAGDTE